MGRKLRESEKERVERANDEKKDDVNMHTQLIMEITHNSVNFSRLKRMHCIYSILRPTDEPIRCF